MAEITRREGAAPDHRLPPAGGSAVAAVDGRPADPDALRRDIEDTRVRMSRTLDQIEGRLVHEKERLVARATLRDLRRKIFSEPWRTMAMAFAAGYIIAAIRD